MYVPMTVTLTFNKNTSMEFSEGSILTTAVVERKTVTEKYVKIRYHKKKNKLFDKRYPSREFNVIWLSDDEYAKRQYCQARKLRSGDEIWVEIYGDEWSLPERKCGLLRRICNRILY